MPTSLDTYKCPLNVLLFHIGHHHHQQNNYNYLPIYSYHNNHLHHNHYQHLSNVSRSSISLMLLSEIVSTDGPEFDWTQNLPVLFHYCLINFDNTKQIIGEHAKKLFLGLLRVICIQSEMYTLVDLITDDSVFDAQSIVYDRKYTNNNCLDSTNPVIAGLYNNGNGKVSVGNCHYNYNFNTRIKESSITKRPLSSRLSASSDVGIQADKVAKAKQSLVALLSVMSRSKNSPIWPYELITSQNYSKSPTSVDIINDFVKNLVSFMKACATENQPFVCLVENNDCFDQLCLKWSQYAFNKALRTTSRHYAGRSLQIYRALGIKFQTFSTMVKEKY